MIPACALEDLPPGESVRIQADVPIAVFNADGELYAIDDTCSHQDASLADGWLEGCFVECPLHAALFDLRTGMPSCLPAKKPVRTHTVLVYDDHIYVDTRARELVDAPAGGHDDAVPSESVA
ncbi:MAG: bifunctional 3-phenylpropionate/cinnamic acid dioxygenase ferredoxin subunit [Actinophytocola sp.]|nr:bifunctional 3-phenylpropionate/cinnamic acid dioxygenase ferredoxin subunit [Actinophytocola sp.]